MQALRVICVPLLLVCGAFAQLTKDQKIADFTQLADLYAKKYAPYEWKRDVIGFDLLNVKPWLAQVAATTNDLDFYDVCLRYVASLNDGHDTFSMPSNFRAYLHFDVDIYDDKVLIEYVDNDYLDPGQYSFEMGDELVSVDGKTVEELITQFMPYNIIANTKATRRLAADFITYRLQAIYPRLAGLPDTATVVIRRQNGNTETYEIQWDKRYNPITTVGPVPSPQGSPSINERGRRGGEQETPPDYLTPLRELQNASVSDFYKATAAFTGKFPAFDPPPGFKVRLGPKQTDVFLSGTYPAGGKTIAYIRIPDYSPSSTTIALQQFQGEIAYFEQNTDGLIVDDMRNPGGNVCYAETLLTNLIPYPFQTMGYEIRATTTYLNSFNVALQNAKDQHAPQWVIDLYGAYVAQIQQAFHENRGRTGPLPLCGPSLTVNPATDTRGNTIAYTKPVMVLTDEFSASSGDVFPAIFQDAGRGPIFGWRSSGLGGTVINYNGTNFSEANTRVTVSLMHRPKMAVTDDFPTVPYIENVGVRPDIGMDYMTKDNLMNYGASFVDAFTSAMLDTMNKGGK